MTIITLTSDWGLSDYYVAAVKGTIYTSIPDATIIDITHSVEPWDVTSAAFVLKNCYRNFPEGTIHIIGIETEESMQNPHALNPYLPHHSFCSERQPPLP